MNMVTLSSTQMREAANVQDQIEALKLRLAGILNGQVAVGVTAPSTDAANPGKKRKMSAAARQKMSESAQARWAKQHAAEQNKALGPAPTVPAATDTASPVQAPATIGEAVAA